jgi:hypothetical protein
MSSCTHTNIECLNEFELIRKYRCNDCGAAMMCACDEKIGRKFLPHQLYHGRELETRQEVPVTIGFQPAVCRECRGLPLIPHPVGEIYGRTSKIQRYYWRELSFKGKERFATWVESQKAATLTPEAKRDARKRIAKEVLEELKVLHATSPKYVYLEESEAETIKKFRVDVIPLKGVYVTDPQRKGVAVLDGTEPCGVEEFASRYFRRLGFETLVLESLPFHVLFGTFMWLVIQDSADPQVRIVSFGDRHAFENKTQSEPIWTHLPDDFGTVGYGRRRAAAIDAHFSLLVDDTGELKWLFDYWLKHSEGFRQYLWAHRDDDIRRARQLLDVLPPAVITKILRYLVDHYWERYLGWPDLLAYREEEFLFIEVKSSRDKLSEAQKNWIGDNYRLLHFPFKLVKVHKAGTTLSEV